MKHLLPALMLVCTSVVVRATDADWVKPTDLNGLIRSMTELKAVAAAAPLPATTANVDPLTPETIAFLKEIGLNPWSEDVLLAHKDGTISSTFRGKPVSNSLESLAKERSIKGTISFVTTRVFISKLKVDFKGTPIPNNYYDGIYLTKEERGLVADKLVE